MTEITENFLKEFHGQNPSCTSLSFDFGRTDDGKSSYQLLVDDALKLLPAKGTILDVACGDGYLLSQINEQCQTKVHLYGIDMSPAELEVAKKSLPEDTRLFEGRAQSIDMVSASADVVVSHMALMLMTSIDDVFREVSRILRKGGLFSFVVPGEFIESKANSLFNQILDVRLEKEKKKYFTQMGDPRFFDRTTMSDLLSEAGFGAPTFEHIALQFTASPEKLAKHFSLMYEAGLLSPRGRDTLESDFTTALNEIAAEGTVTTRMGLVKVRCLRM